MIKKFTKIFDQVVAAVQKSHPANIVVREPSDDTHFRDTDIGARIEWTDGKMIYWIIMDARRIQSDELERGYFG